MEREKPDITQVSITAFGRTEVSHVEEERISMNSDRSVLSRDSDVRSADTNTFAKCKPSHLLRHRVWKHETGKHYSLNHIKGKDYTFSTPPLPLSLLLPLENKPFAATFAFPPKMPAVCNRSLPLA